jgi:hypothetical protein
MEREKNKVLDVKQGKITIGSHTRNWNYNIKNDVKKMGCDSVEWIQLAQNRVQSQALVQTVMKLRIP